MIRKIFVIIFLFIVLRSYTQQSQDSLSLMLEQKSKSYPALNSKVNISVSQVALDEFLRAIAVANKLNLDIPQQLDEQVVNNFSGVAVKDMLAFLCKQYNLYLEFTGNIISIKQYEKKEKPYNPKVLQIEYDAEIDLITFNLKNDSLLLVAEQITRLSNANVVVAPELHDKTVSSYIQNSALDQALDKLAFANNLNVTLTKDGFFLIESKTETETVQQPLQTTGRDARSRGQSNRGRGSSNDQPKGEESLDITKTSPRTLTISAQNYPLAELIKKASEELGKNYFIVSKIEEVGNVSLEDATYDDLLMHLFHGTKYTFKKTGHYYVIGDKEASEIKEARVIVLENRTVDQLVANLPEDVYLGLNVKEFPEMNALLVNGTQVDVENFHTFIKQIDKTVPVILIEVIIAYVNRTKGISTGLDAGIGDAPTVTKGTLNPGLDVNMGADFLNNMINSFDGFGWLNLSELTPNFYMHLKMLEEEGFLDIKSTPKLSTLNGHEATMSIGNTEYYQEEQTQIIGTQNPQTNTTTTYKSVKADLSITILPIVSGKENITMRIAVKQSDFTEKISPFAPPNTVDRNFESQIRVKNGEIILLGGLEEAEKSESGSGWPILSRIPVIKWIFSSRSKKDSKSKLTVFIKPTIIP